MWEADMSDYVHPETLVNADWVAQHIDHPNIRLIDVDEDTTAYEQGHIPKAVGWHWFTDLHDPVRRDYVDREGLSRLLQQAGVGPDTTVVLYGGSNNWFAAYAYWLCRAQALGARRPRAHPRRPRPHTDRLSGHRPGPG
jgi:thiosulfate/3-mercaptopyruvate sulfurtransferase